MDLSDVTDEMVRAFRVAERTAQGFRKKPNERVRAGLAAALTKALAAIERPDSPLCDCPRLESTPTNPDTKAAMDHHCDCRAVETAAILLGGYDKTEHAKQCVCRPMLTFVPSRG